MKEHTIELRVRYKDTDQMGVMYYSNYLVWFEVARTEFFRKEGMVYRELEKKEKIYLPVAEAQCKYKAPLRYDDLAVVKARVSELGRTRLTFEYEVVKDGKVTTTGWTKHAFVDAKGKPIQVPEHIRQAFTV